MIKQNNISFWAKSLESDDSALLSLRGTEHLGEAHYFDVAIIGGGFTGLWLAYYLKKTAPLLKIAIFEKEQIGYGASGRNGGWLSREVPVVASKLKRKGFSNADIQALHDAMAASVEEVIAVCKAEAIECDLHLGGVLTIGTNAAQVSRFMAEERDVHESILTKEESCDKINIPNTLKAHYDEIGARIHPLKLILGLKQVLLAQGVVMYENREVLSFSEKSLQVVGDNAGSSITVSADNVICCTEAYSEPLLKDRNIIPINSSIIVTEVISADRWKKIGWKNYELLADDAHLFFYAQRTQDNRILIGGRGSPYQYGGKDAGNGELDGKVQDLLLKRLHDLFPWEHFKIDYAWKGSIGVTRDWCATVTYDDKSKIGKIYGFVGSGVTATNLAARTMCDRIMNNKSTLTTLPWNDYQSQKWEPEPFRYVAIQGIYGLLRYSDYLEREKQLKNTAFVAQFAYKICGLT